MSRQSTMPVEWQVLAGVCGSVQRLAGELGISYPTLFRIASSRIEPTPEVRERVIALAKAKGVKSPLQALKPAKKSATFMDPEDLEILELLGASSKRKEIPESLVRTLSKHFGEKTLIKIADRDDVSASVHAAVAILLGL